MKYSDAYRLLHDGMLELQAASEVGIHIDSDECVKVENKVKRMRDKAHEAFRKTSLWADLVQKYGTKSNINSTQQLGYVLYTVRKLKPAAYTDTGRGSVAVEALEALELPELEPLLKYRKYTKILNTYLKNFMKEEVNGVMHPFFHLHSVKTYRGSSSRPNFQNVPKHDLEAQNICRSILFPRYGHRFLEVDYSALEVRIAAAVTNDTKLAYDAIEGDMHKDMAIELYCLDGLDKHHKGEAKLRFGAKHGFVFPQFYGDYYAQNVPLLLKHASDAELKNGTHIMEHLANKDMVRMDGDKVVDYEGFMEHVRQVERDFWSKRYVTYAKWKDDTWNYYVRTLKIRYPTGFIGRGEYTRNEALNAPIQGSAFHCLLWSFVRLSRLFREMKLRTKLVAQIHDAILFDVHPDELEEVAYQAQEVMTNVIRSEWDWITVPLDVEAEVFDIDGPWTEGEYYEIRG